jgi:hypothetical protein
VDGEVAGGTPEVLRDLMVREIARWRRLIEERQIAPE